MGTESVVYRVIRDWVTEGVRPDPADTPQLVGLIVTPPARILDDPARQQQLVVRARYADGSARDVTRLARYNSTDPAIARVDDEGRVVKQKRGETTILVSFEHLVATAHLIFREPVPGLAWVDPPANNFIDQHVFAKLKLLRLPPSELSSDAMFCRRIHLDLIGLVPTPEELIRFVEDGRPDKRARLIDGLLRRPEYVNFWTLKWADRLGCNQRFTGVKGAISFHRWIRDQIAGNVPFDQFVRAIITAKGPNFTATPGEFLPPDSHPGGCGRDGQPGLPRRATGMCPMPQPRGRSMDAGRLLQHGRVLQPGPVQERAAELRTVQQGRNGLSRPRLRDPSAAHRRRDEVQAAG